MLNTPVQKIMVCVLGSQIRIYLYTYAKALYLFMRVKKKFKSNQRRHKPKILKEPLFGLYFRLKIIMVRISPKQYGVKYAVLIVSNLLVGIYEIKQIFILSLIRIICKKNILKYMAWLVEVNVTKSIEFRYYLGYKTNCFLLTTSQVTKRLQYDIYFLYLCIFLSPFFVYSVKVLTVLC